MKNRILITILFCLMIANVPAYSNTPEASTENVQAIVPEALDYMDVGAYVEAADIVTSAIEISPEMAELYLLRSECYLQQQEYKKAYSDSIKAISIAPKLAAAHHACAVSQYYDDTYGDARYRWIVGIETDAINLDPSLTDAYTIRAYANFKLKNYNETWNDVNKIKEKDPDFKRSYFVYLLTEYSGGEPQKMFFFF